MKGFLLSLILILLVLFSPVMAAQNPPITTKTLSTTTCTTPASAGCLIVGTAGVGGLGVQLTGTFVGTISFYGSVDGVTYVALSATPVASTTPVTTATAPGTWALGVGGLSYVKVAFSAYTSGSAVASTRTAPTTARVGGGGGGGSPITGADTQVLFFNGANTPAGAPGLLYDNPSLHTAVGNGAALDSNSALSVSDTAVGTSSSPYGIQVNESFTPSGNTTSQGFGVYSGLFSAGMSNLREVTGVQSDVGHESSGTLNLMEGLLVTVDYGGGLVTTGRGVLIAAPSGSGTVTNHYGLQIANQTFAGTTANYAIDVNSKFRVAPDGGALFDLSVPTSITSTSATTCGTTSPTFSTGAANSRGSFVVGATAGSDCTLTFSIAAPHAWVCSPSDETTAVLVRAVEINTTSTKFQGVMTAGDKIGYLCAPY